MNGSLGARSLGQGGRAAAPITSRLTLSSGGITPTRYVAEDDDLLTGRWQKQQDELARRALVARHDRLVRSIAWRFRASGEPTEDLAQEGFVGLLRAIDLFNPSKGAKFSTYAACKISGSIQHYLRDRSKMIRQPAYVQEVQQRLSRERDRLTQELGRDPRACELADALGIEEEELSRLQASSNQAEIQSLDAALWDESDNEAFAARADTIADPDSVGRRPSPEERILLAEALKRLPELEATAVRMFFFEDRSYADISRELGMPYPQARQLVGSALRRMRRHMTAN